ncbi:MAG: hypothetical protein ACJAZP_003442 [Psychromonas sp.]|jgi:hypothetical protein
MGSGKSSIAGLMISQLIGRLQTVKDDCENRSKKACAVNLGWLKHMLLESRIRHFG